MAGESRAFLGQREEQVACVNARGARRVVLGAAPQCVALTVRENRHALGNGQRQRRGNCGVRFVPLFESLLKFGNIICFARNLSI